MMENVSGNTRKEFFNIPNFITFARLAMVPVLAVLMLLTRSEAGGGQSLSPPLSIAVTFLFIAASVSDLFDGYFARKYKISSTFGTFFDPLADKMLYLTVMVMMIPLHRIPAWLVILFLTREMIITALRGVAVDKHIVIAASEWGKYKSLFVTISCVGLLLHYPFLDIQWRLMGWLFMVPALAFSLGSGVHYSVGFVQALKQFPQEQLREVHPHLR